MERIFDTTSNITINSLLSIIVKENLDKTLEAYYDTILNDYNEVNSKEVISC